MQVKSPQPCPEAKARGEATITMVACGLFIRTHKYIAVRGHAGISIIHVVDAAVIEHARRITLVYPAAREVHCIGVHDSGHAGGHP